MSNLINFRSLNNIPSKYGTIKSNKIFRGGPLENLTQKDKHILIDEGKLGHIYDLRSIEEIRKRPDDILEAVRYTNYNITKEIPIVSANPATAIEDFEIGPIRDRMQTLYRNIILDPHAQRSYGEFLNSIAQQDISIYFHCSAGKDRTGLAAVFLLHILGVELSEIRKDYLETNSNLDILAQKIKEEFLDREIHVDTKTIHNLIDVHDSYLEAALETIDSNYTSLNDYITHTLNVSTENQQRIIQHFITMD